MKKIYIALAVLATAALASCVQEKSFRDVTIGENDLVFTIQGAASTRSAESISPVQKGVKFQLEADEDGQMLFLEETIQDLNAFSPVTRGTPAYTENVGVLYANDVNVYGNKGSFTTEATFENMDDAISDAGGWRYRHNYSGDPWPTDGSAVDFYLNMPAAPSGLTISSRTGGKFTISYTSPTDVADQEDILFAYRALTKEAHHSFLPNGAPVLFNHALTGVKFAIANYDADKKITIKSVSFKGLVGTATCEISPASEDNYKDNKTNYSSASADVVKWTIPATPDRSKTYSSGLFGEQPVDFSGGSFDSMGNYPDSFASAGNEDNLNDEDASQTFWFIPQAMTDDVTLTIEYTFGSDESRTGVLNFGEVLSGREWKAGQLRTYTIRVDEVNVMIEDHVEPTATPNTTLTTMSGEVVKDKNGNPYLYTYYGGTKDQVVITNTGNTDAYIRAALIGQWLDDQGNPVFGFTDYTAGKVVLVDSWYQDQFVSHAGKHGYFVDLPGYSNQNKGTSYTTTLNKWFFNANDGYYYYTEIVPAGTAVPNNLFTSYTVDKNPAVVVAGAVKPVYFRLEISTQAITAKRSNGTDATLSEAWSKAGVTVSVE